MFLSVERPEAPSHFAALVLVDPSQSPGFTFERFAEHLAERIAHVPRFRWKVYDPPFGIDRPYWIEDETFDFSRHLRRVAVPDPADRTALAQLVAFLHAQPLDRTQPLWEAWWIEGLPSGRIGVMMKVHHSLMDGQSSVGLSAILMDLTPEPTPQPLSHDAEEALEDPPRRPGLFEMGRTAFSNNLRLPQAMALHARRALAEGLSRSSDRRMVDGPPPVPRVGFNGRLSRQRKFAFASIPLGPLRDAKKHFDVKMNDVLLEIVASTLRRGLSRHGDLPADAIVALCPVSLRQENDQSYGNQIASMPVSLATDVESLPRRIAAIHESAEAAKTRLAEGAAFETLAALGECLVPGMLRFLTGVAHAVPSLIPLPANLVISNVRGLPVPTYLAGARVQEFYPLSMLQVANGMNVTAVSHEDQVDFGFLVDSNLVPDPWIYADGVHSALRDLEAEVAGVSRRPARERRVSPGVLVHPGARAQMRDATAREGRAAPGSDAGTDSAAAPGSAAARTSDTAQGSAAARTSDTAQGEVPTAQGEAPASVAKPESGETFTSAPEWPATDAFDADEDPLDLRMVIAGLGRVRAPREHVGKEVDSDPGDPTKPASTA